MHSNIFRPISNCKSSVYRDRTMGINSGPNIESQLSNMKIYSKVSSVLLHKGNAPSLLIPNYLSYFSWGGFRKPTSMQTVVILVSNLICKDY